MGGAARVHVHSDPRVLLDQRACRTCVIEVNVGQEDRRDVRDPDASTRELASKSWKRARRSWIDQRHARRAVEHRCRDDVREIQESEINVRYARRKSVHG